MLVRVTRAYTTELALPTPQVTACKRHAGVARKQEVYRTMGKSPTALDLHRELNALKQTVGPWRDDVSTCAPQEALRHLDPRSPTVSAALHAQTKSSIAAAGWPRHRALNHISTRRPSTGVSKRLVVSRRRAGWETTGPPGQQRQGQAQMGRDPSGTRTHQHTKGGTRRQWVTFPRRCALAATDGEN